MLLEVPGSQLALQSLVVPLTSGGGGCGFKWCLPSLGMWGKRAASGGGGSIVVLPPAQWHPGAFPFLDFSSSATRLTSLFANAWQKGDFFSSFTLEQEASSENLDSQLPEERYRKRL